jgi:hypothetical protein
MASLLCRPLELFEAQYRAGLKVLETVLGAPAAAPQTGGTAEEVRRLQELSAERVRRGLPPPKEIYQLPYRNRIDWSAMPEWARPTDPELFEGSAHEG